MVAEQSYDYLESDVGMVIDFLKLVSPESHLASEGV